MPQAFPNRRREPSAPLPWRLFLRAHYDRRSTASAQISNDPHSGDCRSWGTDGGARVCRDVALALAPPILFRLPTHRLARRVLLYTRRDVAGGQHSARKWRDELQDLSSYIDAAGSVRLRWRHRSRESGGCHPLIRDIGHENYEVFDDSGRAARSDDFGKVAEHHEHGRERPSKAIFRTSRELLTAFPASGGLACLRNDCCRYRARRLQVRALSAMPPNDRLNFERRAMSGVHFNPAITPAPAARSMRPSRERPER